MIIYAENINTGGALVLLREMQARAKLNKINIVIICSSLETSATTIRSQGLMRYIGLFKPSLQQPAIYFGNLPPIVRHNNSAVYIHNTYLSLPLISLIKESLRGSVSLKYLLLGCYLRFFAKNCDAILVQTPSMQKALSKILHREVMLYPFFASPNNCGATIEKKAYTFCAIGLPSKHKIYLPLIRAIDKIVAEGEDVNMVMTVPETSENQSIIEVLNQVNDKSNKIVINNLGLCSQEMVWDLYYSSEALVFPSLKESFGLPLIEAAQCGLTIFAPDLAYVDDVVNNTIIIDPIDSDDLYKVLFNWVKKGKPKNSAVSLVEDKGNELLKGEWYRSTFE